MAKKKRSVRHDDNRIGKICIGIILVVFMVVMSLQIQKVYQKDLEKIVQEEELREQYQYELDRQKALREYQEHIESDEYVIEQAQSKGGLLFENQIIFRENNE